ncbi:MAG: type I-E CRISPR-associated protein Cas5/CasD [Agrobacterium albertimagni]
MPDFIVFTLAGPMASFGTVAGNERRGTEWRPGHSMLVGILAAALGIRRKQAGQLAELSDACQFAVRVDRPGTLMTDYHTAQSAKRNSKLKGVATRREMLLKGDRTTIVTFREYLMDVQFTVAVAFIHPTIAPAALVEALQQPALTLYLGRKSCPPSLPLNPKLIADAAGGEDAFYRYDIETSGQASQFWGSFSRTRREQKRSTAPEIALDARLGASASTHRRERRRVRPVDRGTWRFDPLDELVLSAPPKQLSNTGGGTGEN